MTTDEAIALIPPGWHLRLTSFARGWSAEIYNPKIGFASDEGATPADAIERVVAEAVKNDEDTKTFNGG